MLSIHPSPKSFGRFPVQTALCLISLLGLRCSASVLATFPPPTTLENIAVSDSGNIFTSALNSGVVYEVTPSGTSQVFGQAGTAAYGLSFYNGSLYAASTTGIYQFGSQGGTATLAASVAGAKQLNGLTLLSPGVLLATDSVAGVIWQINLSNGSSSIWSNDPVLQYSGSRTTGANGIKVFNGSVYVSNTSTATVYRIPILSGNTAGTPQVYANNLSLDDFAFAADGTLFGATQTGNSVVRLSTNGTVTTIATAADGILGDSSIAFGRTASDAQNIYVSNNGGAFENLPGGQQPGSVVTLNVGINGAIPELEAVPEPSSIACFALGAFVLVTVLRKRVAQLY